MRQAEIALAIIIGAAGFILLRRSNSAPGTFSPDAPDALEQYGGFVIPKTTSQNGIAFIQNNEGFKNVPYTDSNGKQKWGYGTPYDPSMGLSITKLDATNALVNWLASEVEPYINQYVTAPIDQNQYDALADFVFNVGGPAFQNSTLLKMLNALNYSGASAQFAQWALSAGQHSNVLAQRRANEQGLFNL